MYFYAHLKYFMICMKIFLSPILLQLTTEVSSQGSTALLIAGLIILIAIGLFFVLRYYRKKKGVKPSKFSFSLKRIKVDLLKDRMYKPKTLTLRIKNKSRKDIDVEAPVLMFRKLWSKRMFRLKGLNRYEIYPLYLEAEKTHELRISLNVFHEHDKSLKRFYWAKVYTYDTKGREYSSRYVKLRRSLFT